jgi:hypothetical protein
MEAQLPPSDGVRWFNRLYLEVSVVIRDYCRSGKLYAPPFLEDLAVDVDSRYFDAFDAAAAGARMPDAWAPLFESRHDPAIAPLQFALAGLNAHVNHDLALGVVATCQALSREPTAFGPERRDYDAVNSILQQTEAQAKAWLLTGAVEQLDHEVAPLDDATVIWSIERARDAAWVRAEVLWRLRDEPEVSAAYLAALSATTGMEGRALLLPHRLSIPDFLAGGEGLVNDAVRLGASLLRGIVSRVPGVG